MFSVDNFYDFFQSHYGFHKTNAISWIFHPHGSKNIIDAKAHYGPNVNNLEPNWFTWSEDKKLSNAIIMHDQEPFYKDYSIDTYRKSLIGREKTTMWEQMTDKELFLFHWGTFSWPIFCHSEINSPDIDWVKSTGVIDCYYFWHGLVSRDWFRHWRHVAEFDQPTAWRRRFLLYIRDCSGTREYRSEVKQKLSVMRDQIDCDWNGTKDITSDYSAKIVINDALNTAIQIVAETVFGPDKIYLTEKIFKPMVMNQPFIVFSGPGTLKYLRDYGFKTFSNLWDEGYDEILDPNKRLNKIVDLINTLYQMPEAEFQSLIRNCQDIVKHNRRWFFSDDFENLMLNELHTNVQAAIKKQQSLRVSDPGGATFNMFATMRNRNVSFIDKAIDELSSTVSMFKTKDPESYQKISEKYPWIHEPPWNKDII